MDKYMKVMEQARRDFENGDAHVDGTSLGLLGLADELYVKWGRECLRRTAIQRILHDIYDTQDVETLRAALREIWTINVRG